MKTSKVIWTIVIIAVILGVIAYFVNQNNKNKTVAAAATAPTPNKRVVGPIISNTSTTLTGKWKQVPNLSTGACPEGATSGKDLGEQPIGNNNGNPVYRCYISTAASV